MTVVGTRAVTDADFEFLFALHAAALGPYVDQVWGWDDDDQRARLARGLDPSTARIVTADGAAIGRLDVDHRDDETYLALIELLPEYQGRGLGGMLVQGLLERARADRKPLTLSVLEVNTRAHALYRRLGFTETARDGVAPEVRIHMAVFP